MKERIAIVGLNGSGKSTLTHALAKELGYFVIDAEDYYFPEQVESRLAALECRNNNLTNHIGDTPYSRPRSKKDVQENILKVVESHKKFILCGVTLNWSQEIISSLQSVFYIKVNTEERVKRVES